MSRRVSKLTVPWSEFELIGHPAHREKVSGKRCHQGKGVRSRCPPDLATEMSLTPSPISAANRGKLPEGVVASRKVARWARQARGAPAYGTESVPECQYPFVSPECRVFTRIRQAILSPS